MNKQEMINAINETLSHYTEEGVKVFHDMVMTFKLGEQYQIETPPERIEELRRLKEEKEASEKQAAAEEKEKRIAKIKAQAEAGEEAFNAWVKKYKASFKLTDIPDRYCAGKKDLEVMINYIISQLGYTPSSDVVNALFYTQAASFVYGFRKGSNYVNNQQKKKATKGGNL